MGHRTTIALCHSYDTRGNFRDLTLIHGVHFAAEAWSGHLLVDDDILVDEWMVILSLGLRRGKKKRGIWLLVLFYVLYFLGLLN